jgi:hypothetical protein
LTKGLFLATGLCFSILAASCKQRSFGTNESGNAEDGKSETETIGIIKQYRWDHLNLSVCWLNDNPIFDAFKTKMKLLIEKNLKQTAFRTEGWANCDLKPLAKKVDVKIFIYDDPKNASIPQFRKILSFLQESLPEKPGTPSADIGMKTYSNGLFSISINVNRNNGLKAKSIDAFSKLTPYGKQNRIEHDFLHEFGHLLGLHHEHAHEEASCHDEFGQKLNNESQIIGPYNKDSIMSYCTDINYDNDPSPIFNSKDIAAINKMNLHLKQTP